MNARPKVTRHQLQSTCSSEAKGNNQACVKAIALDAQAVASKAKQRQPNDIEHERPVEADRRLEIKPPKVKALKRGTAESDVDQYLARAGLMRALGTGDPDLTIHLLAQVVGISPHGKTHEDKLNPALAVLHGINPQNELEGLIAIQMLGAHNLAMEFMRRATLDGQTVGAIDSYIYRATRLMRTFTALVETLNHCRGKGEQKVVVKHVHVHEGAQAIVGSVTQNRVGEGGE